MAYPKVRSNVASILNNLANNGPQTRQELVDKVRPEGTVKHWGCDLFAKTVLNGPYVTNRREGSLVLRGMVEMVSKRGRTDVWAITQYGKEVLANAVTRGVVIK
jgi:hypothetical protein